VEAGDVGLLRLDGDRSAVGSRAGESDGGDFEQVPVAVMHDPPLGSGQHGREPATHRAGAATEIVDDPATGFRRLPTELFDEVEGTRRSIGRLAEGKPLAAHADGVSAHRAAAARAVSREAAVLAHPASV
jgi:hypothetical protein